MPTSPENRLPLSCSTRPEPLPVNGYLRENLPLIAALGIRFVHWHLYTFASGSVDRIEDRIGDYCGQGVEIGADHGFKMAVENNSPEGLLYVHPEQCANVLRSIPGLGFVWDLNHTRPDDTEGFIELSNRMQMLHISDTPLPQTNHHLPLGLGSVPVETHVQSLIAGGFSGPMILEIGGHPVSGGHGRDTDEALVGSFRYLESVIGENARSED